MLLHPRSPASASGVLLLALLVGAGCRKSSSKTEAKDKDAAAAEGASQTCTGTRRCEAGKIVACGSLNGAAGGTWKSDQKLALCRTDCSGWDVGSCSIADDQRWELVRPTTRAPELEISKQALCNDGSEFGFYVQIHNARSKKWLIALGGEGACDHVGDPASGDCNRRAAGLVSGVWEDGEFAPDGETKLGPGEGGLLSADVAKNPTFADYNKAYGVYCSSDLWSGGSGAQAQLPGGAVQLAEPRKGVTSPIQFHGANNFAAMVELLFQRYGLTDTAATTVLLVGSSAGAQGVYANASVLAARLPVVAGKGHLRVVADGAYSPVPWVRDPADPNTTNVSLLTADGGTSVWDVQACPPGTAICDEPLHPACLSDSRNAGGKGACWLGPPALAALSAGGEGVAPLPTMIVTDQLDAAQYRLQSADPWPGRAGAWREQVASLLSTADTTWPLPASAWVYAPCGPLPSGDPPKDDQNSKIWRDPADAPKIGGATIFDQLSCFVNPTGACVPVRVESPCPGKP